MTIRSNVQHTDAQIGKPTEPVEIPVAITVEDASRTLFFRQAILTVTGDDHETVCEVAGGGGLGSDLIMFTYTHTDGEKRTGAFHLAPVIAAWIEKIDAKANENLLKTLRGDA